MKKGILLFFIFLSLLFASITIWVYLNRNNIKQKAINAINQQLVTPVNVNGNIEVTFISTFPNISLQLENVLIKDKFEVGDTLAFLSKVNIAFNLIEVYKGNYNINSVNLQKGKINLKTDVDGNMNFDIIKKRAEQEKSEFSLNLNEITIKNVALKYLDKKENINISTDLNDASVQGKFNQENFLIKLNTQTFFKNLNIKETSYLKNKLVKGKIHLNYTSDNQCFELSKNEIDIEGVSFVGTGNFCNLSKSIKISAIAKGANLEKALKLIPAHFLETSFDANGAYTIQADIAGNFENPSFKVNFELANGRLNLKQQDLNFNEINLKGNFNSENNQLQIAPFSIKIEDANFSGFFALSGENFNKMNGEITGAIKKDFLNSVSKESLEMNSGNISFDTINFEAEKRKIDSTWILKKLSGNIDFEKLSLKTPSYNKAYFNVNGNVLLDKNNANFNEFIIEYDKNKLETNLKLSNYLEYFQTNEKGANKLLEINGEITSKYFNINDFISENKKEKVEKEKTETYLSNWLKLKGKVNLKIDELHYLEAILKDISGEIIPENNQSIRIQQLEAKGMDGSLKGNILFNLTSQNLLEMTLNTHIKKMNIQKIFSSFQNFNQTSITDKNIKGSANAKIFLHAVWNENGEILQDKLVMQSDIDIIDGELIKLQSLMALSGQLSVEQLEHIYFSDMSSTITILDREILIPKTNIQSNLLTLDVHGKYSFDNIIDYAIVLNLKNLLATKFKKKRSLDENFVNDTKGGINIYVSIKGPIDDLTIKYDKKSVRSKIKDDFKNEKENFKNIFKKGGEVETWEEEDALYYDKDDDKYLDW